MAKLFDGTDPDALYNMSTDIFIVDTPWLIEKLEAEIHKEHPEKLRYILRDLAVEHGPSLLNTLAILPIFIQLNPTTC